MYEKNNQGRVARSMKDFEQFVNTYSLLDSFLMNTKFTWTNGETPPIIYRLDIFLVSNCWEDLYPHFIQETLSKIASDHWPILLNARKINYGAISFWFENMWVCW